MTEEFEIKEAAQRETRPPDPAPEQPVGRGEILRRPAAAHFHYRHPVALFGQPMRGDTAAEAGADHDEIEIQVCIRHVCPIWRTRRAGRPRRTQPPLLADSRIAIPASAKTPSSTPAYA